ncbi:MAG TPA: hypothetical protein VJY34_12385 [Roseiarcus sp.]|nr:hypothetical protein [Roseiarcus sp.]
MSFEVVEPAPGATRQAIGAGFRGVVVHFLGTMQAARDDEFTSALTKNQALGMSAESLRLPR